MLKNDQLALGEKVPLTGKGPFPIFDSHCRGQMSKQKGWGRGRGMAIDWATAGKEWKKRILGKEVGKGRHQEEDGLMLICLYGCMEFVFRWDELCAEGFTPPAGPIALFLQNPQGVSVLRLQIISHQWPSPGQGLDCLLCLSMWQGLIPSLHLRGREGGSLSRWDKEISICQSTQGFICTMLALHGQDCFALFMSSMNRYNKWPQRRHI